MKNISNAQMIKSPCSRLDAVYDFKTNFSVSKKVKCATLEATALGVYVARLNGERVGNFVFAPGWTSYHHQLQVQTYDVTDLLNEENELVLSVAGGWKTNRQFGTKSYACDLLGTGEVSVIAALTVEFDDGTELLLTTNDDWSVAESKYRSSYIYNGYLYDANYTDGEPKKALAIGKCVDNYVDQIGEIVCEQERLPVRDVFVTPKGEKVLDFGQNMTGYVEFRIKGKKGETARIKHAEVLDANGNFYTDNLRGAKALAEFVCDGEEHVFKPDFNFYGFRYICLENWSDEIKPENFTAVVVHSDMKRTGRFECSDERVNKLYSNVIWGQKSNFVDVPTDCPQRDERLGWTGDAQVFIKAATYNYDVEKFFKKWLSDLRYDQTSWGSVPDIIPNLFGVTLHSSAAWGDAATICPWQIYQAYGDINVIKDSLDSMKKWVDYITMIAENGIWPDTRHYADWLNLEEKDSLDGGKGTNKRLLGTAMYVCSLTIVIKSLRLCGEDSKKYEDLRENSINSFRREFMENGRIIEKYETQTACILAAYFGLTDNIAETVAQLNELITECGHLKTGFVGTPYLLHVLSDNGYVKTAYDLLLREEYPSWLFSVKMGATTIWEHWDGMREDGTMWSDEMNSFNHYAYGAVADWLYGDVCGIKTDENKPGYEHIILAPLVDERLTFAKASLETRYGTIRSEWKTENGKTSYSFIVPEGTTASIKLNGKTYEVESGEYNFTEMGCRI